MLPKMQSKYGNKDGQFASWGDVVNSNYDPSNFFRTGVNTINSVSLSTGTSKNQTYVSVSATNSTGILPNNKYERYNVSGRNTASFLNDKLTLDFGANLIFQNDRNMTAQGRYFNPLTSLYLFPRAENFDAVRMYERYNEGLGFTNSTGLRNTKYGAAESLLDDEPHHPRKQEETFHDQRLSEMEYH